MAPSTSNPQPPGEPTPWSEAAAWQGWVTVTVPASSAENVSALLWALGAIAVAEHQTEIPPDAPVPGGSGVGPPIPARPLTPQPAVRLEAGFPAKGMAEIAARELRWAGRHPEVHEVDDQPWLDEWKQHAEPTRSGDRIVVWPSWVPIRNSVDAAQRLEAARGPDRPAPRDRDLVVKIDAGRSFGDGSHPTTRMALAGLERTVRPDDKVLDVGCGSGVLAITAALLGARCTAIDIDPHAITATRSNAELNGVSQRIATAKGQLRSVPGRFQVIVANLLAGDLTSLAPELAGHLLPGGTLFCTGLLDYKWEPVANVLRQAGLQIADITQDAGWTMLTAVPDL